jgi:hypothetical protein
VMEVVEHADGDLLIARESLDTLFPDDGTETHARTCFNQRRGAHISERPDMTVESFWLGQAASWQFLNIPRGTG